MSTLPQSEAILLEIHQSFGCPSYQTTQKSKFSTGQMSLPVHKTMGTEILLAIFDTLYINHQGMAPQAQVDTLDHFMEFAHAYKHLELNTWTFSADQRQILWMLLGYLYVPELARRVGLLSRSQAPDKGMPGGCFWYLPEPCEVGGKPSLSLPVAQVVDWLLDLLGIPLEKFAAQHSESTTGGDRDSLRRNLYNWRNETLPLRTSIEKNFADDIELNFKGAFSPDRSGTPAQQFADSLEFVKRKGLTADTLRLEIPMSQKKRLESILDGDAGEDEQAEFVKYLAERYAAPSLPTIRQRLLLARAVQDGYTRLLKILCPNVDLRCAYVQQNKLLQLCAIYKHVYNLTIDAWDNCRGLGEDAEDAWFENHLPEGYRHSLFLAILPSQRETAHQDLAQLLTRRFDEMQADAELEDHIGFDVPSEMAIMQRNTERTAAFGDEINSACHLVARMKTASPWRTLQDEHRYRVVCQVVQHTDLSPRAKEAAIQRLRTLAATPAQTVQAILLELDSYLNGGCNQWPKNMFTKVQSLLDEAEASEGFGLWEAPLLQYKAKHRLACNDFEGASKLFREALKAGLERNYGPLRGEVARDYLALEVANRKLIPTNHEKYYREMLAGDVMEECADIPPLEETARWASGYFWNTLYKPYPGIPAQQHRSHEVVKKMFAQLLPLLRSGDQGNLQDWIRANRPLLKSNLPDVERNSILMGLIKMRQSFQEQLPLTRYTTLPEQQDEARVFEAMLESTLEHWRQFLGQLAQESPAQLDMHDFKGQTPLMLMAEAGDTELVRTMLQAGANPDIQDWKGMTALHSACKSRADSCVDALLDHPCKLDLLTHEKRSALHTACWAGNIHAVKRLLQLAPGLVWERDSLGCTPLELAESLIEDPNELKALVERRAQDGQRCASVQELKLIVQLLEPVPPAHSQA